MGWVRKFVGLIFAPKQRFYHCVASCKGSFENRVGVRVNIFLVEWEHDNLLALLGERMMSCYIKNVYISKSARYFQKYFYGRCVVKN